MIFYGNFGIPLVVPWEILPEVISEIPSEVRAGIPPKILMGILSHDNTVISS